MIVSSNELNQPTRFLECLFCLFDGRALGKRLMDKGVHYCSIFCIPYPHLRLCVRVFEPETQTFPSFLFFLIDVIL
uniref:Expressed protein n=1 Tax=Echinococcus granulosus TaxID=6210 RepID=A0A068WIL4_ECHGR|nr:expressed protein [Echinococcus granulosus]